MIVSRPAHVPDSGSRPASSFQVASGANIPRIASLSPAWTAATYWRSTCLLSACSVISSLLVRVV
jgi:hypothetical protein